MNKKEGTLISLKKYLKNKQKNQTGKRTSLSKDILLQKKAASDETSMSKDVFLEEKRTPKKAGSLISMAKFREAKLNKTTASEDIFNKEDSRQEKFKQKDLGTIVYMPSYYKKSFNYQNENEKQKERGNMKSTTSEGGKLIILDEYRNRKNKEEEKRPWKKEFLFYGKEAAQVASMTFLFVFMFSFVFTLQKNLQPITTKVSWLTTPKDKGLVIQHKGITPPSTTSRNVSAHVQKRMKPKTQKELIQILKTEIRNPNHSTVLKKF